MPATAAARARMLTTHPFDDDKLREECGVFGIWGADSASAIAALGLHALQHRGQEAAGITSFDGASFHSHRGDGPCRRQFRQGRGDPRARRPRRDRPCPLFDHRRDRRCATSSRCSPSSPRAASRSPITAISRTRCSCAASSTGAARSSSRPRDTEVIIHLVATSSYRTLLDRFIDALKQVEGAYSPGLPDRARG